MATNYYKKGEVDTLVAGAGAGVSNPIELVDANTSIERYINSTKFSTSLDLRTDQEAIRLVLGGASDGDTDTYVECSNNTGVAMIHKPLWLKSNINMDGSLTNLLNNDGLTFFKSTTDASNVLTVKNSQGCIKMHSFSINAYNTSNDSQSLLLLLNTATAGGAVYCNNLGIGAATRLNVAGGGSAIFSGDCNLSGTNNTFNKNILVNSRGRIYQQSNANFSLNFISTNEQNFCIQSNRNVDPTASDIFINLNDTNGIALNKPTVFNDTVNTIGKFTSEGEFEVDVGLTGTPEFSIANDIIYLYGTKFQITNTTAAGSVERIYMRNNDLDLEIYLQIQSKDVLKLKLLKLLLMVILNIQEGYYRVPMKD